LLLAGCATTAESVPRVERPARAPETPPWHRFAEAEKWPAATRPFRSEHLTEERRAVTHVSPEAAAEYPNLVAGKTLPERSALVEALATSDGAKPSEYLVMERQDQRWSYLTLDAEGRPKPENEASCRRCHEEALSDELFGTGNAGLRPTPME
jgi:hypothetical protein